MAPDVWQMKALATALKLGSFFNTVDRLAGDWIERGMREKKAEDFEETSERREWYDLRDGWERAIDVLRKKISKFRQETGFSPILGYKREADKHGVTGKVFLGFDSAQAKGYSIVQITFPVWFEELNLPTEEMSEEDIYKLVPVERLSDEQERTLRESFVEDLREAGIERFDAYWNRFNATTDKKRTYNENVFRVDALVQTIIREHALAIRPVPGLPAVAAPVKPTSMTPYARAKAAEAAMPTVPPVPAATVSGEVKVKVKVEEGTNPGEYFGHLFFNGFEADFVGFLASQGLKEFLDDKEHFVDFEERLGLQGYGPAHIQEELKKLPSPFSSGEEIRCVWTDQDVQFTPTAREWWDAFNKVYSRAELEAFDFERLKTIAKLKGVRIGKEKGETVLSILGIKEEPTAPTVRVVPSPERKGLTAVDVSKLQDVYSDALFRQLGRVPTNSMATFRVEIDKVRGKTFSEAQEHILGVASDIVGAFVTKEKVLPIRRVEAPVERQPERGVSMGRVPPAQFPSFPLCYNMRFPRGPCSEEKIKLWDVFCYQMQESDYNCMAYQRQFEEYIEGTQFLSWEDLRTKFKIFVETIKKGLDLPPLFTWQGAPIPTGLAGEIQERLPLEKVEDLVVHFSSVVIRNARSKGDVPTLDDLKEELVEHGVIPESTAIPELRDAAKMALTRALERKDLWVSGITTTEINDFLASD